MLRFANFALIAMTISGPAVVGQSNPLPEQTLSIRRVTLNAEQLPAALAKVEQGTLIRMTPAEFDRLLASPKKPSLQPALVAARYRAKYIADAAGEYSLRGTAEWAIRKPEASNGLLRLDDLGIALRQAKWSDGEDAVLYKTASDAQPCLYVPAAGDRTLNLDWSVRGIPEPGEVRFELRLPAAPIASLELECPADLTPVFPQADVLVTGPFPANDGEHLWRIACGELSRVEIVLSRPATAPNPVFISTNSVQTLGLADGLARFEFQVESARNGFSELTIRHDPALHPTSVTVNNLLSWTAKEGDTAVVIKLREPARSASIILNGTYAVTTGRAPWSSPDAWVDGGIQRSERLRIAIPSTLTFRDWRPGNFALRNVQSIADRTFAIDTELVSAPVGDTRPERPALVLSPRPAALWSAAQYASWTIGTASESWQVRTVVTVSAGSLSSLQFVVPETWEVERVESPLPDLAWSSAELSRRLRIDLGRSARRGDPIELTIRLRGKRQLQPRVPLALPDLFPDGAERRTGTIAIRVDPMWEAILSDPLPGAFNTPAVRESTEVIRNVASEALVGSLTLHSRRKQVRAELVSEALFGCAGQKIRSTISIVPTDGAISELRLWTDGPVLEPWVWRDRDGRRVTDAIRQPSSEGMAWLLSLVPKPAIASISELATLPECTRCQWQLHFPRLWTQPTTLVSEYATPDQRWSFPGVVGIPFQATASVPAIAKAPSIPVWLGQTIADADGTRIFRYGTERIANSVPAMNIPAEFDTPTLITTLLPNGQRNVNFRVRARGTHREQLSLTLPEGSQGVVVSVAGRPLANNRTGSDGRTLAISVPTSTEWIAIEVRYRLSAVRSDLFDRVPVLAPTGPFDLAIVRHVWHISPEWVPINAKDFRGLPGESNLPPRVPLPDWRSFAGSHFDRLTLPETWSGADEVVVLRDAVVRAFPGQVVIIDLRVIHSCGISSSGPGQTGRGSPSMDSLVTTQCSGGILVTRAEEVRRWQAQAGWDGQLPADVFDALESAVNFGSDPSGRFRTLASWSGEPRLEDSHFRAPPGWIVLESESGDSDLLVVQKGRARLLSWLGGISLAIILIATFPRRLCNLGLMAVFLGASCASIWLPALGTEVATPIAFTACVAYVVNLLRSNRSSHNLKVQATRSAVGSGAVALMLIFTTFAIAADRPIHDVFQLVDREGRPTAMLVAPDVMDRLNRERGSEPTAPEVVITSAVYAGKRDGESIRFQGKFHLYAFRAAPARLVLPLGNARVRALSIDGSEAGELDANPDGIRVALRGKGPHTLEVDFSVPIAVVGSDREIRVSVPEVPLSHLTLEPPVPGTRVQTSNWRGAVSRTDSGIRVDLGLSPTISLRWLGDVGVGKPSIRVKEVSAWQVGPVASTLTGVFDFHVTSGSTSVFRLAVPASAEMYQVSVAGDSAGPQVARIRDWQISPTAAGPHRTLTVDLLTPVSGRVTVRLEMVATTKAGESSTFYFPRALDTIESEFRAAVVTHGSLESADITTEGLVELPAEPPIKFASIGINVAALVGKLMRSFRATGSALPRFIAKNERPPMATSATESATWWIGSTEIVGVVETKWVTSGLPLLEWTLPEDVRVVSVTGTGLQSWSQSGGKVQAWLNRSSANVELSWRVVRTRAGIADRVNVPVCGHLAKSNSIVTRTIALDGQALLPISEQSDLIPLDSGRFGEIAWRSTKAKDVSLAIVGPPTSSLLNAHTSLRANGERIEAETTIDLASLPADRPTALSVYVPATIGSEVRLDVPAPLVATEAAAEFAGRRWNVGVPTGHVGPRFVSVTVSSPGADPCQLSRPRVFAGPNVLVNLSHTLSIDSNALTLHDAVGLSKVGSEWRSQVPDWSATIARNRGGAGSENDHLGHTSIHVARIKGAWHYRGVFDATLNEIGAVQVLPPNGATIHRLFVDDASISLTADEPIATLIDSGSHRIEVRWSSQAPSWTPVRLLIDDRPLTSKVVDWLVRVPSDLTLVGGMPVTVDSANGRDEIDGGFMGSLAYKFETSDDHPAEVYLEPVTPSRPWLKTGVVLLAGLLVGLLAFNWPCTTGPEQAAGLAFIGAVALGPAGACLLLIPVGVVFWRVRQMVRRLFSRSPWQQNSTAVA